MNSLLDNTNIIGLDPLFVEGNLGVYAKVVKGGRLNVGDTLTQLADAGDQGDELKGQFT